MGISGLLPLVRDAVVETHLRTVAAGGAVAGGQGIYAHNSSSEASWVESGVSGSRGLRVGVDVYVWMHRGMTASIRDVCNALLAHITREAKGATCSSKACTCGNAQRSAAPRTCACACACACTCVRKGVDAPAARRSLRDFFNAPAPWPSSSTPARCSNVGMHAADPAGASRGVRESGASHTHTHTHTGAAEAAVAPAANSAPAPDTEAAGDTALFVATDAYLRFCLDRLALLIACGCVPVCVMDGAPLPGKARREAERAEARRSAMLLALECLRRGDVSGATPYVSRCVDVSPACVCVFMREARTRGVECIVAPYEADAQLAYMAREGLIDAVLTEDSDLVAHGCPNVLLKLRPCGSVAQVRFEDLRLIEELRMRDWTYDMWLDMCILAGCDYLDSLPGMGAKTAHTFVSRHRRTERILQMLAFEHRRAGDMDEYRRGFMRARQLFKHQRVFDPRSRRLVHASPITGVDDAVLRSHEYDFLGPWMTDERAAAIADGLLEPCTGKPYTDQPAGVTLMIPAADRTPVSTRPTLPRHPPLEANTAQPTNVPPCAQDDGNVVDAPSALLNSTPVSVPSTTLGRVQPRTSGNTATAASRCSPTTDENQPLQGRPPPLAATLASHVSDAATSALRTLQGMAYSPFTRAAAFLHDDGPQPDPTAPQGTAPPSVADVDDVQSCSSVESPDAPTRTISRLPGQLASTGMAPTSARSAGLESARLSIVPKPSAAAAVVPLRSRPDRAAFDVLPVNVPQASAGVKRRLSDATVTGSPWEQLKVHAYTPSASAGVLSSFKAPRPAASPPPATPIVRPPNNIHSSTVSSKVAPTPSATSVQAVRDVPTFMQRFAARIDITPRRAS